MAARQFFLGFPSVSDFIVNLFRCCLPGVRSKNNEVSKDGEKLMKKDEESKGEDNEKTLLNKDDKEEDEVKKENLRKELGSVLAAASEEQGHSGEVEHDDEEEVVHNIEQNDNDDDGDGDNVYDVKHDSDHIDDDNHDNNNNDDNNNDDNNNDNHKNDNDNNDDDNNDDNDNNKFDDEKKNEELRKKIDEGLKAEEEAKNKQEIVKMAGSTSLLPCGMLRISIGYDSHVEKAEMKFLEAKDLPSKERGGATQVQVRTLLLPIKKQRSKTKVVVVNDCASKFEDACVFKIKKNEVESSSIRMRLYGKERLKKDRLIGETMIHLKSVNLENEGFWMQLEPRNNLSHGDSLNSLSSLNSASSSNLSLNFAGSPELMIGLAYNWQTGRLAVEVIKGSNFKSVTAKRPPDTYVKIGIVTTDNREISKSRTSLRKSQPNPLYKETFMFQIPQQQLENSSLLVSVFVQKSVKRNLMIGWFTMGHTNSSEDEASHWAAMLTGKENQVCRWHTLLEP